MNNPLWVLDTNVVLDLLHFDDPVARPLLAALAAGRVRCVASEATFDELKRVLAYPEFGIDAAGQARLLDAYRRLCGAPLRQAVDAALPRCSDPDDQKFLELAAASGAMALVTKDRALLKLSRRCARQFAVIVPADAVRSLDRPAS